MADNKSESGYSLKDVLTMEQGIMRLGQVRSVVFTESAFVFLQQVIHEQMPELTRYGFYEMGYRGGLDLLQAAQNEGEDPEKAFRYSVETFRQTGYGDIEVVHFDLAKPEAVLRGRNLLETSAAHQSQIFHTPRTVDHYARGMFAGMFSQLLGKEVVCEELQCEYRGDDACEFVILPFGGLE